MHFYNYSRFCIYIYEMEKNSEYLFFFDLIRFWNNLEGIRLRFTIQNILKTFSEVKSALPFKEEP